MSEFKSEHFKGGELADMEHAAWLTANTVAIGLRKAFGIPEYQIKSDPRDWVTKQDKDAQEMIVNQLGRRYPDIGFLGEEDGLTTNKEVYWVIDPIDGTSHFVRGNEFCTTMIALVDNGTPVVSVIYDFMRDESYNASLGNGATSKKWHRPDKPLHVSNRPLGIAYMELYTDETKSEGKKLREDIEATGAYLLRNATAGYTWLQVARGSTEAFVSVNNPFGAEWDIAAGALLVHEAGGIVRNAGSESYNTKNFNYIAANRLCYGALTDIIARQQA